MLINVIERIDRVRKSRKPQSKIPQKNVNDTNKYVNAPVISSKPLEFDTVYRYSLTFTFCGVSLKFKQSMNRNMKLYKLQ